MKKLKEDAKSVSNDQEVEAHRFWALFKPVSTSENQIKFKTQSVKLKPAMGERDREPLCH